MLRSYSNSLLAALSITKTCGKVDGAFAIDSAAVRHADSNHATRHERFVIDNAADCCVNAVTFYGD